MGQSTNGQICFGVVFDEGHDFPWDEHDGEDEWWRAANGYKPPFELYDAEGEYLGGKKPPEEKIVEAYDHRRRWEKEHPLPVALVNYCSAECPMWIVAIPSSVREARRGYPLRFSPADLSVSNDEVNVLMSFLREYVQKPDESPLNAPTWYLSSYWG